MLVSMCEAQGIVVTSAMNRADLAQVMTNYYVVSNVLTCNKCFTEVTTQTISTKNVFSTMSHEKYSIVAIMTKAIITDVVEYGKIMFYPNIFRIFLDNSKIQVKRLQNRLNLKLYKPAFHVALFCKLKLCQFQR